MFTLLLLAFAVPARAQSTLDEIKKRGKLLIGSDCTYPPFEFQENGKIVGFEIDLSQEIAKELGVTAVWEHISWDGAFGALTARKYDLVMAGVTITDERKKSQAFSRPYFLSGQTIVRRKDDPRINSSKDLLDKKIAVIQETTGQYGVEKLGVPTNQISKLETQPDTLLDVRNKRSDAAVGDLPAVKDLVAKSFPDLTVVGGVFVKENLGIAMRQGDPALLSAINQALTKIFLDGRFATIYKKWIKEPLPDSYVAELDSVRNAGTPEDGATKSAAVFRPDLFKQSLPLLLEATKLTIELTIIVFLFGTTLGLLVALLRISPVKPLQWLATVYVEVLRGTPLLLQVFAIYYILPSVGINLDKFPAAVVALSLNAAAYMTEIFRAGIESIEAGQMEAARALGMNYRQAMWYVILPQTLRRVLPPMTNELVALLKDTSLVSVIGLAELMTTGRLQQARTGSPATIYAGVALIYLCMTVPLTWLVRRLEQKWKPVSRG
jgi:His/Glu/Gln/Arg/opine family amino acid ABC transporter permease subunit